jgi:hypothetical protein
MMMRDARFSTVLAGAIFVTLSASAGAQWLKYKTPGIPRTPDGKPDLSAPAPRTADGKPDFGGSWRPDPAGNAGMAKAMESLKPEPWAEALAKRRQDDLLKDDTGTLCLPPGPRIEMGVGRIVQAPNILVMLFQGTLYREIFLDGRPLPQDPNPDWMGYSVGRWEGDTLVIESAGFNDRTWLDNGGHPHTEALHVTERIRRPNFGHLEVQRTMIDPGALTSAWTVPLKLEYDADTEPLEYVCNENEKDRMHLVGKASDEKSTQVPPEILSRYVATYSGQVPGTTRVVEFEISLSDGQLTFAGGRTPKTPLRATSETEFSAPFGNIKFVPNDKGTSDMILQAVEGDVKAVRK